MNYEPLNTVEEAKIYIDSLRDDLGEELYKKILGVITDSINEEHKITKKVVNDFITCEKLRLLGKFKEAQKKETFFQIENANIYLKAQGLIH